MFIILICGDGFVGIYVSKLIQLYFLISSLLYIKRTSLKLFKKRKRKETKQNSVCPREPYNLA